MRYLAVLCVLLLVLNGCDDKKSRKSRSQASEPAETTVTESSEDTSSSSEDTRAAASASGGDTQEKAANQPGLGSKSAPKPVPDNSLTIQEYIKLKVPDPSRLWQGSNYKAALTALKKLADDDVSKLPRADSPKSGKLFARLVSVDNLKGLRNRDLSLQARLSRAEALKDPINDLGDLYVDNLNAGLLFDVEVAQLSLFDLDLLTTSLMMVEDIMESLPEDEEHRNPNHPDWAGVDGARREVLDNFLQNLDAHGRIRPAHRVAMAEGALKRWPDLMNRYPENLRNEYRDRLTKLMETEPNPKVKAALKKMAEYKPPEKKAK